MRHEFVSSAFGEVVMTVDDAPVTTSTRFAFIPATMPSEKESPWIDAFTEPIAVLAAFETR